MSFSLHFAGVFAHSSSQIWCNIVMFEGVLAYNYCDIAQRCDSGYSLWWPHFHFHKTQLQPSLTSWLMVWDFVCSNPASSHCWPSPAKQNTMLPPLTFLLHELWPNWKSENYGFLNRPSCNSDAGLSKLWMHEYGTWRVRLLHQFLCCCSNQSLFILWSL